MQKSGGCLKDPLRIRGAVYCALGEAKSKKGHLFLPREVMYRAALKLLNERVPVQELRIRQEELERVFQDMILGGAVVLVKDNVYLQDAFARKMKPPDGLPNGWLSLCPRKILRKNWKM